MHITFITQFVIGNQKLIIHCIGSLRNVQVLRFLNLVLKQLKYMIQIQKSFELLLLIFNIQNMFDQNDNAEIVDVINFDEYASNAITPKIQIDDQRPSSPPKIIKNEQFHKNLGQNQAYYKEDKKFDINQIKVENTIRVVQSNSIQQKSEESDEDDFGSVIQFQEIAEKEDQDKIQQQEQIDINQQNRLSPTENRIEMHVEESPKKIDQVGPSLQNSVISNTSVISAYPLVNKTLEFNCTKEFLTMPLNEKGIVQCSLIINTSGLNKLKPKFYLEKNGKIYLAAKKSSHKFIISMNKDKIQRKSSNFIGQISCKKKYDYMFYDNGNNPKRNKLPVRNSLGQLKFITSSKPTEPRQQEFRFPLDDSQIFMNRKPKWNEKTKSFTLNFYDRVKISSIKNFQLIKINEQPEQIYVQLGKENDQKFNLDFQSPLSPLIAFMIALANYDKKIEY
ncbi:unnamed protein product [Paramecium sonneborni]|uniref:Tubby C-terminal domain-containing protein n=1 Tax=Paramecium sonneborni TaxID=65129 RepID=A0A8S1Q876_9CILI|nr:unnamed protein product [Paramecium sonneborni]